MFVSPGKGGGEGRVHKRAATSMDLHNVLPSIQAKKPEEENFLGFVNENINHLQSLNAEEYHRRVVAFDLRREFNKAPKPQNPKTPKPQNPKLDENIGLFSFVH